MAEETYRTAVSSDKSSHDNMTQQALEFYRRGIKVSTATWVGAILAHMERQAACRYGYPEQQLPAIRALKDHSEQAANLLGDILQYADNAASIVKAVNHALASTDRDEVAEYLGHAERYADTLQYCLDRMPMSLATLLGLEVEAGHHE